MRKLTKFTGIIAVLLIIGLFLIACNEPNEVDNGNNNGNNSNNNSNNNGNTDTPTPQPPIPQPPTTGLSFTLIDGPAYSVSIGTASDVYIVIPSTNNNFPVTTIKAEGFKNSVILSVSIPNSITTIGDNAFQGCIGLTSITIPNSVTSIGSSVFEGCTGLTSITIGNGVTSIGYNVFSNTGIWKNAPNNTIVYADKWVIGYNGTASGALSLNEGTVGIGPGAFYKCTGLSSITIPESVTYIGEAAFCECDNLTSVTIPAGVTSISDYTFSVWEGEKGNLKSVTFESGSQLQTIGKNAFIGAGITSITIPTSVTSIGDKAFQFCEKLDTVTFAAGTKIKKIGDFVFSGCKKLSNIEIPASVTSIGEQAFGLCDSLSSIEIPASITSIGYQAFILCSNLSSVTFENGSKLKTIGEAAFADAGITSIIIPASVTSIGDSAFADWEGKGNLKNVTFESGSQLKSIGEYAFACAGITSIIIPASVTSIGDGAFNDWEEKGTLKSVTFESGSQLKTIGEGAFACAGITSIIIPASVTSIGDGAFNVWTKEKGTLESITFESGSQLKTIGKEAFSGSGIESIIIPVSVTSIGEEAFAQFNDWEESLKSVTFEGNITNLSDNAFDGNLYDKYIAEGSGTYTREGYTWTKQS